MPSSSVPLSMAPGYLIQILPEPPGQFTAQVPGIAELRATAATRDEAIAEVRKRLSEWLASGRLALVDLPREDPAMQWFGHGKDDPEFDQYLAEIRGFREQEEERLQKEMDQQPCSASSSTPTT